jgi:hypothetical protein
MASGRGKRCTPFTGGEGSPQGSLVLDAAGNLYDATVDGGDNFQGTVFELSPSGDGTWTKTVLYSFGGYLMESHP